MQMTSIKNFLLSAVMVTTAAAGEWDATPYVGLEGGYGSMRFDNMSTSAEEAAEKFGHVGLKLGAEGEEFRAFASARLYTIDHTNYARSVSAEMEYMLPLTQKLNAFAGLGIGIMYVEFESAEGDRRFDEQFVSAHGGFDYDLQDNLGLEIGVRVTNLDVEHTLGGVTYEISEMINGYAALIYRF